MAGNIFDQDPQATMPPAPQNVQAPPQPVVITPPVAPVPPPNVPPRPPGCPVTLIVLGLGLVVVACIAFTLITGALGVGSFTRAPLDPAFQALGKFLYGLTSNSFTRLGYQAFLTAAIFGAIGTIVGLVLGAVMGSKSK